MKPSAVRNANWYARSIVRNAVQIIGYTFIVACIASGSGCGLDRDFLLFVNAEPPSEFRVVVSNTGAVSVCGGSNNVTISVTALNEDGSTNIKFRRAVNLSLLDENEKKFSISPPKSPDFTDGTVMVSDITLPSVPAGEYTVRAVDEGNSRVDGTSESFPLDVAYVDHLEVTGLPASIHSGSAYGLSVRALDQNGAVFTDFDGYVDLRVTNNYSIDPPRIKLSSGSAFDYFTISDGSGSFSISPRLSEEQGEDVACTGGLEPGEGGGGSDGDGDGDNGDGGSDADGDGEGDVTATTSEATVLSCILQGPENDVLLGTNVNLNLTITKTDQSGVSFPSFSGEVTFTPEGIGLVPNISDVSEFSPDFQFAITEKGEHTIIANVTDDDSTLTCEPCQAVVKVVEGIAVYGDYASALITKFKAEPTLSDKEFYVVTSVASITPYTALIVNLAGSGYDPDGVGITLGDLAPNEATAIKTFYDGGSPILVAHDNFPSGAGTAEEILGSADLFNLSQVQEIDFDLEENEFVYSGSSPVTGDPNPENLEERYITGFVSGSTDVVVTQWDLTTYQLILAKTSGTKAVLMGEAIWHPLGGDESPETQWWDGTANRKIAIDLINWLLE